MYELNNHNLGFLDKKEQPTEEMVYKAFNIEMEEAININKNIPLEVIENLEEPSVVEVVQGKEWSLTKLVWNVKKYGDYIRIEIVKTGPENIEEEMEDVEYEDVTHQSNLIKVREFNSVGRHKELLEEALTHEDYAEASRLRDWMVDYRTFIDKLKVQMVESIKNEDFELLNEYMGHILDMNRTL